MPVFNQSKSDHLRGVTAKNDFGMESSLALFCSGEGSGKVIWNPYPTRSLSVLSIGMPNHRPVGRGRFYRTPPPATEPVGWMMMITSILNVFSYFWTHSASTLVRKRTVYIYGARLWVCNLRAVCVCDVYVGGKVRISEFMIFLALQQCGSK